MGLFTVARAAFVLLLSTTQSVQAASLPFQNTTSLATSPPAYNTSAGAAAALDSLMLLYNSTDGLWDVDPTASWWISGVAVQSLLDYMDKTGSRDYLDTANNTIMLQRAPVPWWPEGDGDFRGDSTDDTGWWALALVHMYQMTGEDYYLSLAKEDEAYMWSYWNDTTCAGGLIWNIPTRGYHNAISNELFLTLTASLHNVIPGDTVYLSHAMEEWQWFEDSGMINGEDLINDGLMMGDNDVCVNNNAEVWTYNQGVIIGGLLELATATGNNSLIDIASGIANAVINSTTLSPDGILTETCSSESACEPNGGAFKGIFMRYLGKLNSALPSHPYDSYIDTQARSAYAYDRNGTDFYGFNWAGPFDNATTGKQVAAVSLLTAAL
ncbi:MAG: hypothetical protein M1818_006330 [Claussenomyces sp. TS43310]|nr:MAG: hypothetical protein M1818_006330 [Claussenomyces sp. TS43310]